MILSILVETFSTRISAAKLPHTEIHNISDSCPHAFTPRIVMTTSPSAVHTLDNALFCLDFGYVCNTFFNGSTDVKSRFSRSSNFHASRSALVIPFFCASDDSWQRKKRLIPQEMEALSYGESEPFALGNDCPGDQRKSGLAAAPSQFCFDKQ